MKKAILGRTGLEVSVAGLGTGGYSRIGMNIYGIRHAAAIVRTAFDNGVNYFDTAALYQTEEAIGLGLKGIPRHQYVLSSKFLYRDSREIHTAEQFTRTLDDSLRILGTDYIDIYSLHSVLPEDYETAVDRLYPAMQKARRAGKIRFPGITEMFSSYICDDTSHMMLKKALADDLFDVVMIGYNMLNPSAAKTILPLTIDKNIGVQCMYAVRKALASPEQIKTEIEIILDNKQADPLLIAKYGTLDFLVKGGAAGSVIEAAYRFCANTPGVHVTLTGTGNAGHLLDNIKAINMPALPDDALEILDSLFGNVDCVSGDMGVQTQPPFG